MKAPKRTLILFFGYLILSTLLYQLAQHYIFKELEIGSLMGVSILVAYIPLLSVLLLGREGVSVIKQSVNLKGMNIKAIVKSFIIAALAFHLIVLVMSFLLGNVLEVKGAIKVLSEIHSMQNEFLGLQLPSNMYLKFIVIYLLSLMMSLFFGLTINMLLAFGGEVAWRGFLERKLNISNRVSKTIMIGIIWGVFSGVKTLLSKDWSELPIHIGILEILLNIMGAIVFSFLCVNILKRTKSILGTALVLGVINSIGMFYIFFDYTTGPTPMFHIINANWGVCGIIAALVVNYLIIIFVKEKKNETYETI